VILAVLIIVDSRIKTLTGFGVNDLQHATGVEQARTIFAAWRTAGADAAACIGFSLGIDYLFMPLYGAGFFFGGLATRDTLAPRAGFARTLLGLLAWTSFAGMALDAVENIAQLQALRGRGAADVAFEITSVKWKFGYMSMVLTLVGALTAVSRRLGGLVREST
jgi:hypothetical protein